MSKKLRALITLPLVFLLMLSSFGKFALSARAEEIVITGNGESSSNTATISVNNQTSVTQENAGSVQNKVDQNANTGGNTAADNTGGAVGITTGDANLSTTATTSINSSSVDANNCCGTSGFDVSIDGNGADSTNSVNIGVTQGENINVNQNAEVYNYVDGYGNTGGNSASNNSGTGVTINTGDIHAKGKIINGPINSAVVAAGNPAFNFSAIVSGNGEGSTNTIAGNFDDPTNVFVNNNYKTVNRLVWNLVTGNNKVDGNTGGNVGITTGDIFLDVWLENVANNSTVDVSCCNHTTPPPNPTPTPTPTPGCGDPGCTTSSGGGGGSDGGGGGSSSGPSVLGLSFTGSQTQRDMISFAGLALIIAGVLVLSKGYGKKEKLFSFA